MASLVLQDLQIPEYNQVRGTWEKMVKIRSLRNNDPFDDLISLSRVFFEDYQANHPEFFNLSDLRDGHIRDYFTSFLHDEDRRAFIALDSDRIVGYLTVYARTQPEYWAIKRVGEISGLMVSKAYRRRGIASQLLAQAQSFLAQKRVRYLTVYTAAHNQAGLQFYRANGLEPLHIRFLGKTGG
jgi:ribosomal protein S18 acetylase RimI-like enzyme